MNTLVVICMVLGFVSLVGTSLWARVTLTRAENQAARGTAIEDAFENPGRTLVGSAL